MKPKSKRYPILDDKSSFKSRIMIPDLARKCLSTHSAISGVHNIVEVPMGAKLAMIPGNKLKRLYTADCGDKLRKTSFGFDLSFENHEERISNEYKCLHDPNLLKYFQHNKRLVKHLQQKGFITGDNKVICSLKEYNAYRQYLKHISVDFQNKITQIMHEKEVKWQKRKEKKATAARQKDPNDPTNVRINRCKNNRLKMEQEKQEQDERILRDAEEERKRREKDAKKEKRIKSLMEMKRELNREKSEKEKALQKEMETLFSQDLVNQKHREAVYRKRKLEAILKQKSIEKQLKKEEKFETRKAFEIINRAFLGILLKEEDVTRRNSVQNLKHYFTEKWENQQKKLRSRIENERKAKEEENFQIQESLKKRGWTGPPRKIPVYKEATSEDSTGSSEQSEPKKKCKKKKNKPTKKLQQPPMVF